MLVFKMALIKVPLITHAISHRFFSINSAGWKAMNFWVCSNICTNTIIVPEMILIAFFALAIVLEVKMANTIFGCLGHNGHTWANLGEMYLYDFYKIFTKCLYGYFIWKNAKKNWGSPCWLRSGRPKCKLPSKLRKIIHDTKRYDVKGMNLSGHSNILGNIVNALEMILNNPRAVNFICQCFQGKNWPIPYLAVWGIMVIPELIWGRCTYMIFIKFSQNVYMGISFEN